MITPKPIAKLKPLKPGPPKIYITNTGTEPSDEGSAANNCASTCDPTTIIPYIQVNDGSWQQTSSATVSSGTKMILGPQPTSGGTWNWSGCGII